MGIQASHANPPKRRMSQWEMGVGGLVPIPLLERWRIGQLIVTIVTQ